MKFSHIGIRAALAISLILPLGGLLFFSSAWVLEKRSSAASLETIEGEVRLMTEIGSLVHELQKERAVSTLCVGSKGAQYCDRVIEQRRTTDIHLRDLKAALDTANKQVSQAVGRLNAEDSPLARLADLRAGVDKLSLERFQVVTGFTGLIASLLEPVPEIVAAMGERNPEVSTAIRTVSYLSILRGKERAGIQRAQLIGALTAGEWKPDQYLRFAATASEEDTYNQLLQAFATKDQQKFIKERFQSQGVHDANKVRDGALALSTKLDGLGVEAPRWYTLQTTKIDLLKEVENNIAEGLLSSVTQHREGATSRSVISIIEVICLVLVSFLLSFLMARVITTRLGTLLGHLADVAKQVGEAAQSVLQSVTQQNGMVTQQAAAITEMNTTVREIAQTATSATECAEGVLTATKQVEGISGEGNKAVDQSISGLTQLSEQVRAIANTINELSDSTQQIGDIITTVKEVAEQSDLLALNASIEAAKAGEHGRGFAVVAAEMRNLAEQSRTAAGQVKGILGDLTRGMRKAVTATDEGTKQTEATINLTRSAGTTIVSLTEVARDSALAAQQITTTTRQQRSGVDYMAAAVNDLSVAMSQTAAGAGSLEGAATGLAGLSTRLKLAVSRFEV